MIRKYHNHKPRTTPWHREEEPLNHHETPGRQINLICQIIRPLGRGLVFPSQILWGIPKIKKKSANQRLAEHSGSVGRALDWGSKGCWFKPHHRILEQDTIWCLVLVQPRETHPGMTKKLLTGTQRIKPIKQTKLSKATGLIL